jgi:nucleoside-diphosphate kinase
MTFMEQTLIIIKPDALQRSLIGEIVGRLERKGLKIVGAKMMSLNDDILTEHYAHLKDKPFFADIKTFMKHSPVIALALEGTDAVQGVRLIAGATKGSEADAGTIRGDLSISNQNLLHASDTQENAKKELARFFKKDELFEYTMLTDQMIFEEVPFDGGRK